jgi:oligopeptide transport system substrate-binding protein
LKLHPKSTWQTFLRSLNVVLFQAIVGVVFSLNFSYSILAQTPQAPQKVVRIAMQSSESGFDCAVESSEFTGTLCDSIFDSLLQYDHLARPALLQPRTAAAMPKISADGRIYTIKIKQGIRFSDHPAFNGKPRFLTARDYAYSLKRLLDPALKAQWQFLLDNKLQGVDALIADAKKTNKFDYDRAFAGLEAPDDETLIIRLKEPDYNLSYILAMPATSAVARELAEKYGTALNEHPVGTGAYVLQEWRRSSRIVLTVSPTYREDYFQSVGSTEPLDAPILKHLQGKRLPLVPRVEISVIEEEQPRWIAFLNNEFDYLRPLPTPFADIAMPGGKMAPAYTKLGITARPDEIAWLTYTTFNMNDPVIGGYTAEKIALRRAMSLGYPVEEEIRVVEKNQALKAHSPIAEGMVGFVLEQSPTLQYDPARAKALLDMYGYKDIDGDGYRELPNGQPLVIDHASTPDQRAKSRNELWQRAMRDIGIRMTFKRVEAVPQLRKLAQLGKMPMFTYGWIADYPDGENFLQLFTTKSIGGANYSMFSLPEFDAMYQQILSMPDSTARTAIYSKMVRLIWVYNPWRVNTLKRGTILIHPWLIGMKKHPFAHDAFRYLDIDLAKLTASQRK